MKKLLVLILAMAACLCGCGDVDFEGGNDSTLPIEDMMIAALDCNGSDYLDAFPPQMSSDYESKQVCLVWFGLESMDDWLSEQKKAYTESYGDDLEIEAEVIKAEECSVQDVESMNPDPYTYISYVTASNTEKVCAVTLEYTIGGEKSEEEYTKVIYTVKQGGKWYVHPIHAFDSFGM